MAYRTHYPGHDAVYQRKKAVGQAGWDPEEISQEVLGRFQQLLNHPLVKKNGRLLELGCGAGNLSVGFASAGFQVTAIDISPTALEWARERAQRVGVDIAFSQKDLSDTSPFPEKDFDVVVDSHCLHCIIGQDRAQFLAHGFEALRPGGIFILSTMCQSDRSHHVQGFEASSGLILHGDIATRYVGQSEDILKEISHQGFEVVHSEIQDHGENMNDLLVLGRKPA